MNNINNIEENIISCIVLDNSLFVQYRNQLLPDMFKNPNYQLVINFFHANINNKITKEILNSNLNNDIKIDLKANLKSFESNLEVILYQHREQQLQIAMSDFYANIGSIPKNELFNKFKNRIVELDLLINNQQTSFTADKNWLLTNAENILLETTDKLSTGYNCIDENMEGGIERGNLVTLSGNSGSGKTLIGINLYLRMIKEGNKGIFFSTEMTEREMAKRIYRAYAEKYITNKTGITADDIEKIYLEFGSTKGHTIIVEPRLNSGIIRREVLHYKKRGLDFIVIDNLNRMTLPNMKNKWDAYSAVVKELKNIALEEDIVVILLAQSTAENIKSSKNKRLTLADLAGSQDISRESNYVFMMHREAYFKQQDGMIGGSIPESVKYITEVSCVKARENNPFSFCLKFVGGAMKEINEQELSNYLQDLKNIK